MEYRTFILALVVVFTEDGVPSRVYHLSDHYSVCIDKSFSAQEKQLIRDGISTWNTDKIRFQESTDCDSYIIKATQEEERFLGPRLMGLSQTWHNRMLLALDRANDDASLMRWVAAHEAGHWLGLKHVNPLEAPAIMNAQPRKEVTDDLKLYSKDLDQLGK